MWAIHFLNRACSRSFVNSCASVRLHTYPSPALRLPAHPPHHLRCLPCTCLSPTATTMACTPRARLPLRRLLLDRTTCSSSALGLPAVQTAHCLLNLPYPQASPIPTCPYLPSPWPVPHTCHITPTYTHGVDRAGGRTSNGRDHAIYLQQRNRQHTPHFTHTPLPLPCCRTPAPAGYLLPPAHHIRLPLPPPLLHLTPPFPTPITWRTHTTPPTTTFPHPTPPLTPHCTWAYSYRRASEATANLRQTMKRQARGG